MNNGKVRIYELSKELNLDNKELLAICDQLNIAVKSHSSTITESEAERIRSQAEKLAATQVMPKKDHHGATSQKQNTLQTNSRHRPAASQKQELLEIRKPIPPKNTAANVTEASAATDSQSSSSELNPPPSRPFASSNSVSPMQQLPEPVYIQGLIRQYADALGLKGIEFASQFPVGINKITIQPITKTTLLSQLRPIHLYLIYIFVILCAAIGLSELLKTDTFKTASTDLTQEQPQTTSHVQKNLQPVSETTTTSQGQQVQIGITLTKKSWIQVIVDGKIEYEGELPQGFSRTWKAQEMLTVKTNDAGGVLVSINHQKAKQLGEPGKQKQVTIAANTRP